jgi:hypothetical protein
MRVGGITRMSDEREAISDASKAVEHGVAPAVAEALGQFRTELVKYPAITGEEAHEYGATFLEHLLESVLPHPHPSDD